MKIHGRQKLPELPCRQLPFLTFIQDGLLAFPNGFLPPYLCVPVAPPSTPPFPSPFEFRCNEPVGEGERGRPFPLPFLFGSCLKAHESPSEHGPSVIRRMQSPLSELCCFFAFSLPFPFAVPLLASPIASCPRLDFSLWNENPVFSAQDIFGPPTSICNSRVPCRRMSCLECRLAKNISTLPTFQLASCTDSPMCCQ